MKPAILFFCLLALLMLLTSCDDNPTETTMSSVEQPQLSPPGGTYEGSQYVFMTCKTLGASIYYTIDGTEPSQASFLYEYPVLISALIPSSVMQISLKAKAFTTGMNPSPTTTVDYAATNNSVASPVINPAAGEVAVGASIFIECLTPDSEIRYTTNGSDPTASSTLYTVPVLINSPGSLTVKAKAFKAGLADSPVTAASYTVKPASPNMVMVSGGTFNNGFANITVSSFYMEKYEVTQAQYAAVMGVNPASGFGEGADYPVYNITWTDAITFCNYRSIKEGYLPCYSYLIDNLPYTNPQMWPNDWVSYLDKLSCDWNANGYRLPTEMEWMFASKGGTQSQNYNYSGSDDIDDVAWWGYFFDGNSGNGTNPVGRKMANELGLYDMSGNLWEWCWDYYALPTAVDQTNPTGPTIGEHKVRRGGSWASHAQNCTVFNRYDTDEINSSIHIGIRVCRKA